MAFAARLKTLYALDESRYKAALNTLQFDYLKSAAREGGVSAETLGNLDTVWGLRSDGTLKRSTAAS